MQKNIVQYGEFIKPCDFLIATTLYATTNAGFRARTVFEVFFYENFSKL